MSISSNMNWISTTTNKNGFEFFELWKGAKKLMTLELNLFSQTAKIECYSSRRIFKIDKEGFLRHKTIFKNEYGVKVGELSLENWFSHEGLILLNNERYRYTIQNNSLPELIIYNKGSQKTLISCGLQLNNGNTGIDFKHYNNTEKQSVFLMALAWFLFLPVAKENVTTLVY